MAAARQRPTTADHCYAAAVMCWKPPACLNRNKRCQASPARHNKHRTSKCSYISGTAMGYAPRDRMATNDPSGRKCQGEFLLRRTLPPNIPPDLLPAFEDATRLRSQRRRARSTATAIFQCSRPTPQRRGDCLLQVFARAVFESHGCFCFGWDAISVVSSGFKRDGGTSGRTSSNTSNT